MRNILISIISSFLITILTVWGFNKWNSQKTGYIKSAVILQDYKGMTTATEQFNNELKMVQTNLDTLKARFERLQMAEAATSGKEKSNLSYQLGIAQTEYEKYNQQASEQMETRRAELTQKVLQTINDFIQEYGKKNNYKFILGTTNEGSILYGQEADDLTQTILDQLNNLYQEKPTDAK